MKNYKTLLCLLINVGLELSFGLDQFVRNDVITYQGDQTKRIHTFIENLQAKYVNPRGVVAIIGENFHHYNCITSHCKATVQSFEEHFDYLTEHLTFPKVFYNNKKNFIDLDYYEKPDCYIVATFGENFTHIMEFLHSLDNWYPQAKFIILYQTLQLYEDNFEQEIFTILLKHNVFNVIIVKLQPSAENEDFFQLLTYDPYKFENLNDPDLSPVYIDLKLKDIGRWFNRKLPLMWRNSSVLVTPVTLKPYVISIPEKSGIDMDVTEILRDKLQVDLQYDDTEPYYDWGWKNPNGTYVSVFRALQLGLTDFVIGQFHFRDPANLIDFDYTFSYTEDPLIWAVPCPVPISNWSGLILIFAKQTWYTILIALLISLLFWQGIGRVAEKGRYFATLYSIEVPFLLFLSLGIPSDPRQISTKMLYLSSWFFGFILTTSWLSQLTAFLMHETYQEPIKSMAELFERGLILGIHPELAKMYGDSGDEVGTYIYDNFYECDLGGGCWDQVAYQKDMGTITTLRILRYITYDKYMSEKGEQLMIIIEDVHVNMDFTVMFFPKGHPMCPRISQLLMWIREGGFIQYFDVHVNYQQAITNRRELFNPNQLETKKLNLGHMMAPFALLIAGFLIATIVFLCEVSKRSSLINGQKQLE